MRRNNYKMTTINRSFVYGICFASVTWIISLYLYMNLTYNEAGTTANSFELNGLKISELNNKEESLKTEKKLIEEGQFNLPLKSSNSEVDELGLVKTIDDKMKRDEGYKLHAYNILISDRLSYHRDIPDTRNDLCKNISYPTNLPSASIIICFYNEHYGTLLRSIHSIIDRTPSNLLKEIILIDDYSDLTNLHDDIDKYIKRHFDKRVKLFRTDKREGLIRARINGARRSTGEVIIFLDSHIEVNKDWIEPLLSRIKENRKNVVMPIIDIINADTFAYTASPLVRGGFNWGLHFKWENLPIGTLSQKDDFVKPIKSPTMAGGLFAINRSYFTELGEYDDGMDIWGGENLEISFRIWMCGGQLELIPCSRVGHVFRHRRPYGSNTGEDTMLRNSLRAAHVWMDNYTSFFINQRPEVKSIDYGDISSRIALRQTLHCENFDWYLKTIYPEQTLPSDDQERLKKKWAALERDKFQPWHSRKRNYTDQFQLRLSNSSLCMQSNKDVKTRGSGLVLKKCMRSKQQIWFETDKNELILSQILCLQSGKHNPILYKCHEMGSDQEWKHKGQKRSPVYNVAAGMCLGAEEKRVNAVIVMKLCTNGDLINWDIVR